MLVANVVSDIHKQPSISSTSASAESTNHRSKIFEKNSEKFQKAKCEFAVHWPQYTQYLYCTDNYLHSIYIVLAIISILDVI